ncbi:hypothetical protein GWM83_04055 [Candidatus Bathyarchaeota archaeon]|nr:hypothetical protein [Candidatus Bathyarchaeota archaeon]NIR15062.1 hypothetical protein [Desulfobacterales bacterium]NIW34715.1 hypothetical protein [Candidatus Bathyarchaeota archaeon]
MPDQELGQNDEGALESAVSGAAFGIGVGLGFAASLVALGLVARTLIQPPNISFGGVDMEEV